MKTILATLGLLVTLSAFAQTLPVITTSPTNVTVYPGNTATFNVTATGATSYQWIFQGAPIAGATSATLQVPNAQSTNCGYYLVLAPNAAGQVPSQMAYLTLDYSQGGFLTGFCGLLPLSNTNNGAALLDSYVNNGTVQIVVGPELDQMQRVGTLLHYTSGSGTLGFHNSFYNWTSQIDTMTFPGQPIYYGVVINYTNGNYFPLPSTIIKMVAGTNGNPVLSCNGLKFPGWIPYEGIEPDIFGIPSSQVLVPGESWNITNGYFAYTDYGSPSTM